MLYGLGKKVSCPPSTVLHFEFSKNTRRTYDLKLNALLIFRNSLEADQKMSHDKGDR